MNSLVTSCPTSILTCEVLSSCHVSVSETCKSIIVAQDKVPVANIDCSCCMLVILQLCFVDLGGGGCKVEKDLVLTSLGSWLQGCPFFIGQTCSFFLFFFNSNPKQEFCEAETLQFQLELKSNVSNQRNNRNQPETNFLKVRRISRPQLLYHRPSNVGLTIGVSNMLDHETPFNGHYLGHYTLCGPVVGTSNFTHNSNT